MLKADFRGYSGCWGFALILSFREAGSCGFKRACVSPEPALMCDLFVVPTVSCILALFKKNSLQSLI